MPLSDEAVDQAIYLKRLIAEEYMMLLRLLRNKTIVKPQHQNVSKEKISSPICPRIIGATEKPRVLASAGNIWSRDLTTQINFSRFRTPDLTGLALDKLYQHVLPAVGEKNRKQLVFVENVLPWWTGHKDAEKAGLVTSYGASRVGSAIVLKNIHNGNLHAYSWVLLPERFIFRVAVKTNK